MEDNKNTSQPTSKIRQGFGYAINGIRILYRTEWKFTLYTIVSIIVIILMFLLNFNLGDAVIIILVIGFVFICEALNTLVETIFNELSPKNSARIQRIKDISSAFVLISVITAIVAGTLVFWPYTFGF